MSLQSIFRNGNLSIKDYSKIPGVSKVIKTGSVIKSSIQNDNKCQQEYNRFIKSIVKHIGDTHSPKTGLDYLEHFFYYVCANFSYDYQEFENWKRCRSSKTSYKPMQQISFRQNGNLISINKRGNDPRAIIFGKKGMCGDYALLVKDFCDEVSKTTGVNLKCDVVHGNDYTHSWNVITDGKLSVPFDISNYLQFNKTGRTRFIPVFESCIIDSYKYLHNYPKSYSKKRTSEKVTNYVLQNRRRIKDDKYQKNFK